MGNCAARSVAMSSARTQTALLAGHDLLGHFGPAGISPTTPGLLSWSAEQILWSQASYGTANLTEWVREHGRSFSYPDPGDFDKLRLDWQPPATRVVELPDSTLTFGIWMSNDGSTYAADWSMRTRQHLGVKLKVALSLNDLHRHCAATPSFHPLRFGSARQLDLRDVA